MKLIKSNLKITVAEARFLKRCAEFGDLGSDFLIGMEIRRSVAVTLTRKGFTCDTEGCFIALTEKGKELAKAIAAKESIYTMEDYARK